MNDCVRSCLWGVRSFFWCSLFFYWQCRVFWEEGWGGFCAAETAVGRILTCPFSQLPGTVTTVPQVCIGGAAEPLWHFVSVSTGEPEAKSQQYLAQGWHAVQHTFFISLESHRMLASGIDQWFPVGTPKTGRRKLAHLVFFTTGGWSTYRWASVPLLLRGKWQMTPKLFL